MGDQTESGNLEQNMIKPLSCKVGKMLVGFRYHDVTGLDEFTTNNAGIEIIAHQIELQFENAPPLFISWATVPCWDQYSLNVSDKSYCQDTEVFAPQHSNWNKILGSRLQRFEVFGSANKEQSSEVCSTVGDAGVTALSPHMIVFFFENNSVIAVADFYSDDDFIPKYFAGDDLWVIFGMDNIDNCISATRLQPVGKYS